MKRRHPMPFGTDLLPGGETEFRLWAPDARRVDLCLYSQQHAVFPMHETGRGFFSARVSDARAGTRYRFRVDGMSEVPDPASRFQPEDVHGPSCVVDPRAWDWTDGGWRGRPWEEAVIYEIHTGTFSPAGTFRGIEEKLGYLVDLGVTAIELMPVAAFPGKWNWGYDGVLPFAPDAVYGGPDGLKALVQAAHHAGLMVIMDVVYNHFGPEGNYLHAYASPFFSRRARTPWGAAVNFDGTGSDVVREFVVHNALYWVEEFHVDGLRLDAVHAIVDSSDPDILEDIARAVREGPGRNRRVHLVLENDDNAARYLSRGRHGRPRWYSAQWNDDFHHAAHVAGTGESGGYYSDYRESPVEKLGRALSEGFVYQGEPSPFRGGRPRGDPTRGRIPQTAFVNFLQNHDQIGNRAFGERLGALLAPDALYAMTAVLLLAPSPPLLFMGQEWNAASPFLFFCDFAPDLGRKVTEGRREEFASFPAFSDAKKRSRIPDPADDGTFLASRLDWDERLAAKSSMFHDFCRRLLRIRGRDIVPRLGRPARWRRSEYRVDATKVLSVEWKLARGAGLRLLANLGSGLWAPPPVGARGRVLVRVEGAQGIDEQYPDVLNPWTVCWMLAEGQRS